MSKILLGVAGSVAAIRTPELFRQLTQAGHQVRIVATRSALYFFDPLEIDPGRTERNPELVTLDEDEWPGLAAGRRWQRDDPVLHIELRRWADLFLIAPLDANTLAKLVVGLCDNCLTCVWRAWDPARPVVLAPAMNTLMWQHPLTKSHLQTLAAQADLTVTGDVDALIGEINRQSPRLRIVAPQAKRLACGDVGVGAMEEVDEIVRTASMIAAK
jgi:phosphopantothenoylcysteine decarboxylase